MVKLNGDIRFYLIKKEKYYYGIWYEKYDKDVFNREGIHKETGAKYNQYGCDKSGHDEEGYDKIGYNKVWIKSKK